MRDETPRTPQLLPWLAEGFNELSWLTIDPLTTRRRSAFPFHVSIANRVAVLISGVG